MKTNGIDFNPFNIIDRIRIRAHNLFYDHPLKTMDRPIFVLYHLFRSLIYGDDNPRNNKQMYKPITYFRYLMPVPESVLPYTWPLISFYFARRISNNYVLKFGLVTSTFGITDTYISHFKLPYYIARDYHENRINADIRALLFLYDNENVILREFAKLHPHKFAFEKRMNQQIFLNNIKANSFPMKVKKDKFDPKTIGSDCINWQYIPIYKKKNTSFGPVDDNDNTPFGPVDDNNNIIIEDYSAEQVSAILGHQYKNVKKIDYNSVGEDHKANLKRQKFSVLDENAKVLPGMAFYRTDDNKLIIVHRKHKTNVFSVFSITYSNMNNNNNNNK